jgi:hypothetical protein
VVLFCVFFYVSALLLFTFFLFLFMIRHNYLLLNFFFGQDVIYSILFSIFNPVCNPQ